ncbi:MAG: VWA domain-containing protein [Cytophagia bacterium]|nr:MAG: VWA domain-containing protein [Cytophagia bacterium]TAG43861.1 MAG: VWA domain-containing protein [Cytophagia bacterium]TAH30150.1 MAG: VWA domain-containing protein [Cytophagales bacterium]
MERFKILLSASPWWIIIAVLVGFFYAYSLYYKSNFIKPIQYYGLAALRFTVVTIICLLLLLNPYWRQITNKEEKPVVVIAVDNSQSVSMTTDTLALNDYYKKLESLSKELEKQDVETEWYNFSQNSFQMPKLDWNVPSTDLHKLLTQVQNNYENRNIDKVILLSDGIINQGASPLFNTWRFPILSVGLGDTTAKKDLKIQSILANKVAYLGNEFPISAEIENIGFPNRTINVTLSENGNVINQKTINFNQDNDIKQVSFYAQAKQKGIRNYTISIQNLDNEFTYQNNVRDVYVEVIDGKEKILIVAAVPHPDIKALRAALEKNENYDVDIFIPTIHQRKQEKYDLVVFHQIPNINGVGNDILNSFPDAAKWFLIGGQSDLNQLNKINKSIKILGRYGRTDQITPVYNRSFARFGLDNTKMGKIDKLPPVTVPFGDYALANGIDVVLFQKIGNTATTKPLLILDGNNSPRSAILTAEGIWQWRLEEFALENSHESFDDLISKTAQFLSTKEDKRKLRVYPINNEFYDYEKVIFESEIYNDLYERIFDQKINLTLTDAEGKTRTYNFTSAEGNTRFEISGLPKGVYNYNATAQIRGKSEQSTGQFTVKSLQLEALTTTADHNLLKQLAQKTNGKFYLPFQLENLKKDVLSNRKPNLLHSSEEISEMINLMWLFFFLLLLLTIEWGVRKYQGSY